jgi:hypothetical protein
MLLIAGHAERVAQLGQRDRLLGLPNNCGIELGTRVQI